MALNSSVLTGGVNSHPTTSEEANGLSTDFVSEGIVGTLTNTSGVAPATGGFAVNAQGTPDATVAVSAGVAYVTATPTSQNSQVFRVKNTASANVTISANASGSTKYDWIYISLSASTLNAPAAGSDGAATLVASRSTSQSTDDGTPPTYGYPLAVVTVANGFTTITNGNIRDVRANCIVNLGSSSVSSGWTDLGYTPNTVTNNGNRSYSLVFNSVDLTSTLSVGMRLKTTRLVAAPTRCADLEASSSQYFTKTSPNKCAFTDDFNAGAWVKLESYTQGIIISRYNGTSGWRCWVNGSGQLVFTGFNAASTNYRGLYAYQAIPLARWVHVAAQLDMSAYTATSTTCYAMIDGADVPITLEQGGTNPTSLAQAGNLEVGANNGGTTPFDGKLAQVFFTQAKVTQAQIRSEYMSQSIAATATNLGSAYSFDNSITDINTTTPNDLTAVNSAVATNADSPFGTQAGGSISATLDYNIITSASFSTNTTLVVQVPEGCTIPTSGGVSAVAYSVVKAPFGMTVDAGRWLVETLIRVDLTFTSPVNGTWYNLTSSGTVTGGSVINIPVGQWIPSYEAVGYVPNASNAPNMYATLSTANNSETDASTNATIGTGLTGANAYAIGVLTRRKKAALNLSSATPYYLNVKTGAATGTSLNLRGSTDANITISAELATL